MKVYVRWYKNIVEGELLDEEWQGMKLVRIPLDGCHPVALFSPDHVYQNEEAASGSVEAKPEPPKPQPQSSAMPTVDLGNDTILPWVRFKDEHWDHERNHLRTDCLDEFYRIWRECHRYTPVPPDSPCYPEFMKAKPSTERQPTKPVPVAKPQPKKPTKKQMQSSGEVQFNDSTQLALFN